MAEGAPLLRAYRAKPYRGFESHSLRHAERHARSIRYQIRAARFPVFRDLDSFEFKESRVNKQQVRTLYEGGFTEENRNIVQGGVSAGGDLLRRPGEPRRISRRARDVQGARHLIRYLVTPGPIRMRS